MSRALCFRYGSADKAAELAFGIEKIDRKKLYGYVESEVLDAAGRSCELAVLGGDGRTLCGRGGTALLMLDPDGNYVERQSLTPVGPTGAALSRMPSSFDAAIALSMRASVEEFLDHNIKAVYALLPPMGAEELLADLKKGAIYTFPFSFRGGLDPDVGFLIANSEGAPFLLLGKLAAFEPVGLSEPTAVEPDEAPEADDDEDVDFSMM